MNRKKLEALLASGAITQEEFDETAALLPEEPEEDDTTSGEEETEDEKLERLIQAKVDKITANLGKEKAEMAKEKERLKKELERIKREKLSADELAELDRKDKEEALAIREKALAEKENRLYAVKSIKTNGLDDGSDKSLALVDFVLADTKEEIDERVKAFSEVLKSLVLAEVEKKFKAQGRDPQGGNTGSDGAANPYLKDTFNLTKQMELETKNPELAKQLKALAGK